MGLSRDGPRTPEVCHAAPRQKPESDYRVLDFFEKVGLYATQNNVDEDKIYNEFSDWLEYYWPAAQDPIKEAREEKTRQRLLPGVRDTL